MATPAPVAAEITPAPVAVEITPAPVAAEITPAPVAAEITPAPVAAEITPAPVAAEITPAPVAAEITPAPVAAEITPAPVAAEITPTPTVVVATPAPISVVETPSPTIKNLITPAPTADNDTPAPTADNDTPAPTSVLLTPEPSAALLTPAPSEVNTPNPTQATTLGMTTLAPTINIIGATPAPTVENALASFAPTQAAIIEVDTPAPTLVGSAITTAAPIIILDQTPAPSIAPTAVDTAIGENTLAPTLGSNLATDAPYGVIIDGTSAPTFAGATQAPSFGTWDGTYAPIGELATLAPTGGFGTFAPMEVGTLAPAELGTLAPTAEQGTAAPAGNFGTYAPTGELGTLAPAANQVTVAPTGEFGTFPPSSSLGTSAPIFLPNLETTAPTNVSDVVDEPSPAPAAPLIFPPAITYPPVGSIDMTTPSPTAASPTGVTSPTEITTDESSNYSPTDIEYVDGGQDLGTVDLSDLPSDWLIENTGDNKEVIWCMATGTDSTFLVSGIANYESRKGRTLAEADDTDMSIMAVNSTTGENIWTITRGTTALDSPYAIFSGNQSLLIAGSSQGSWFGGNVGGEDIIIIEIDSETGDVLGGFQGGISDQDDIAYAIHEITSKSSGVTEAIIGGTTDGSAFVGHFSLDGEQFWRIDSSNEVFATVALHVDETYGVVSVLQTSVLPRTLLSVSYTQAQNSKIKRILKSTGALTWSSGLVTGVGTAMAVDSQRNMFTVGYVEERILVRRFSYDSAESIWEYSDRIGWANAVALILNDGHPVIVGSAPTSVSGRADMDAFVLTLDRDTGQELCYYSFGSESDDVVTSVVTQEGLTISVSGYAAKSVFSDTLENSSTFAMSIDQASLCTIPPSTAPEIFQSIDASYTVTSAINVATAVSASGAVATAVMAPAVLSSTAGVQIGSGAAVGGAFSFAVISQLQFMATTSLIDANQSPQFSAFTGGLQWMNLWWPADILIPDNSCIANDESGVGGAVFIGNTVLVLGILLGIYVLHVVIVSGIEAMWLAKDVATKHFDGEVQIRKAQSDSSLQDDSSVGKFYGREESQHGASSTATQAPIADIQSSKDQVYFDENSDVPLEYVLRQSRSFWIYFPHVELLFLLFAYEGAVAAEASVLASKCTELVVLSSILLFFYPILLALLAWRVSRAVQLGTAVFISESRENLHSAGIFEKLVGGGRAMWTAVSEGARTGRSMFSCADIGHWEVPSSVADDRERLGRESFMLSYEPVFRDFTAHGANYVIVMFFRLLSTSMIAALVLDGTIASFLLMVIYTTNFCIVVYWQPFANSFMHFAESCALGINSACLLLMWVGSMKDQDRTSLDVIYGIYLMLQCVNIFLLVVPVYIDFILVFFGRYNNKIVKAREDKKSSGQSHDPIRIRQYLRFWRIMIRYNAFAMIGSLKNGLSVQQQAKPISTKRSIVKDILTNPVVESSNPKRRQVFPEYKSPLGELCSFRIPNYDPPGDLGESEYGISSSGSSPRSVAILLNQSHKGPDFGSRSELLKSELL